MQNNIPKLLLSYISITDIKNPIIFDIINVSKTYNIILFDIELQSDPELILSDLTRHCFWAHVPCPIANRIYCGFDLMRVFWRSKKPALNRGLTVPRNFCQTTQNIFPSIYHHCSATRSLLVTSCTTMAYNCSSPCHTILEQWPVSVRVCTR